MAIRVDGINDTIWISLIGNNLGIIRGFDEITKETKYYIGEYSASLNVEESISHILTHGRKIPINEWRNFFSEENEYDSNT